jgi:SAM-dependent methyltransferase
VYREPFHGLFCQRPVLKAGSRRHRVRSHPMQAFLTRLKSRLRKMPGYRLALFIYKLAHSLESRNAALLLLRPPRGLYQPYGTTSIDRYPETFQRVRSLLEDSASVRILSFGCSTGEEVFSLRRYFPEARIVGVDINPFNIAVCRFRRYKAGDKRITFAVAGSTEKELNAGYDAIFAMAVFRHGDLNVSPPPLESGHRIRFADFEQSVADLSRALRPGGLLVIQHAMFRFCDTSVAKEFETVFRVNSDKREPLYGRDNCLLPDAEYSDVVFRKIQ